MLEQPQPSKKSPYWEWDAITPEDAQQPPPASTQQQQPGVHVGAWQTPDALPQVAPPSQPPLTPRRRRKRMRPRLSGILVALVVIVLLGAAGSFSGFQVGALANHGGRAQAPATEGQSPTATARTTPAVAKRATPSATPTVATPTPRPAPQPVILARDSFQRPNQALWGVASDGWTWGGDANTAAAFSIIAGTGRITGGQGFFNAVLGPRSAHEEVVESSTVSHFDQQRDNAGAVLRWSDGNNYDKAYLDGASLILIKRVAGAATRLGAVPFAARDGASYTLRFRANGAQLSVRAWPTGAPEPGTWMVMARDASLSSGWGGLRVLVQTGVTVTVTAFQERSTP